MTLSTDPLAIILIVGVVLFAIRMLWLALR